MTPTRRPQETSGRWEGCCGRSATASPERNVLASLGDGGDVELELDLVRHQQAAGLERGVPGQAPVLAVEDGLALEADAEVAERVAGGAVLLELDRDRLGDVLDGQVAGDGPVAAVAGDVGGDEGDLGVRRDVEEVGALQVAVAVGDAGVDAG